jgi:hypothetical protein
MLTLHSVFPTNNLQLLILCRSRFYRGSYSEVAASRPRYSALGPSVSVARCRRLSAFGALYR